MEGIQELTLNEPDSLVQLPNVILSDIMRLLKSPTDLLVAGQSCKGLRDILTKDVESGVWGVIFLAFSSLTQPLTPATARPVRLIELAYDNAPDQPPSLCCLIFPEAATWAAERPHLESWLFARLRGLASVRIGPAFGLWTGAGIQQQPVPQSWTPKLDAACNDLTLALARRMVETRWDGALYMAVPELGTARSESLDQTLLPAIAALCQTPGARLKLDLDVGSLDSGSPLGPLSVIPSLPSLNFLLLRRIDGPSQAQALEALSSLPHVRGLDCYGGRLGSSLPRSLTNLTSLTRMCWVSDYYPLASFSPAVVGMTWLRALELTWVPPAGFAQLSCVNRLTNLNNLALSFTALEDFSDVPEFRLPNLRGCDLTIYLNDTQQHGHGHAVSELPPLSINFPTCLRLCSELAALHIEISASANHNQIEGPTPPPREIQIEPGLAAIGPLLTKLSTLRVRARRVVIDLGRSLCAIPSLRRVSIKAIGLALDGIPEGMAGPQLSFRAGLPRPHVPGSPLGSHFIYPTTSEVGSGSSPLFHCYFGDRRPIARRGVSVDPYTGGPIFEPLGQALPVLPGDAPGGGVEALEAIAADQVQWNLALMGGAEEDEFEEEELEGLEEDEDGSDVVTGDIDDPDNVVEGLGMGEGAGQQPEGNQGNLAAPPWPFA